MMDERDLPKIITNVPNVLIACGSILQRDLCFSVVMGMPAVVRCDPKVKVKFPYTTVWLKLIPDVRQYWHIHGHAFQQVIIVGRVSDEVCDRLCSLVRPSHHKLNDCVYEITRI